MGIGDEMQLVAAYSKAFLERYGTNPLPPTNADRQTLLDMAKAYSMPRTLKLIEAYLRDDGTNGFFSERGHSIQVLRSNADRVWARANAGSKKQWVVAYSESGKEVVSTNPQEFYDTEYWVKPTAYKPS